MPPTFINEIKITDNRIPSNSSNESRLKTRKVRQQNKKSAHLELVVSVRLTRLLWSKWTTHLCHLFGEPTFCAKIPWKGHQKRSQRTESMRRVHTQVFPGEMFCAFRRRVFQIHLRHLTAPTVSAMCSVCRCVCVCVSVSRCGCGCIWARICIRVLHVDFAELFCALPPPHTPLSHSTTLKLQLPLAFIHVASPSP